ncbi:SDR family NAD(P)-dependent oxidoreductase [Cochlodiniinecator piscidefendens]|uniref:SDR family NAD(P)-dependent oxidoreductase n=1 Tax=Cochlodiniinecator piscidefendens TaxID=2715756 RepID=UPI001407FC80|nr:SDR family oxidoreductase [Cochlodiniinecator piscidefendens]
MSFSISGKTAIVTGAANGVGLAIARHFVEQGANVMFADMDEEGLKHEIGEIDETSNIRFFAGDLRQKLAVANLLSATLDAFDRVDILVNASRQVATCDPLDPEQDGVIETLLDQNLMTSLRLSQSIARRMIQQAEEDGSEGGTIGSIVNLSTIAARFSHPDLLALSVSAAAMEQMTRSLAVALADKRIRVNAVAFGSVMSASLKSELKSHAGYREEIIAHTPMARIAGPAEVAEAVQFLACESASFMTGQIMTVDGGRTLLDPVAAPAH